MNYRSPALLGAVRQLMCQARIPDVCLGGYGQASHSNQSRHGKGGAMRSHDCFIASICPACHVEIDSGKNLSRAERIEHWQRAHECTLLALFESGAVRVDGAIGSREKAYRVPSKIFPRMAA